MRVPSSQEISVAGGGAKTIDLNSEYTYTQVTVTGRNAGSVTATARPMLANNEPNNYLPDDFEPITDGKIDLSAKKRTFTISNKKLTAMKFTDDSEGDYIIIVNQWNRANLN